MKNPWLESLAARLNRVNHELEAWPGRYTEKELTRQPKPGGWSAAECMEHVDITARKYHEKAAPAIDNGTPAPDVEHFTPRHSIVGKMELFLLNPQRKLKVKAPGSLRPRSNVDTSALVHCIRAHKALLQLMAQSDGFDLNQIYFRNPVVPLVRMNFTDLYLVLTLHAERHLAQARRALRP